MRSLKIFNRFEVLGGSYDLVRIDSLFQCFANPKPNGVRTKSITSG